MTELVVTGAGGALGSVLMRVLLEEQRAGIGLVSPSGPRPHLGKVFAADLLDSRSYEALLFSLAPKVIVHLAAVSQIAACYDEPEHAHRVNVDATARLLQVAAALGARFIHASTDLVFDGNAAPYDEDATTEPGSLYGRTKLEAECHVLAYKRGLVVRFPLMYGFPEVERAPAFFATLVSALREGRPVKVFHDEVRTPLWLEDAARGCITLADSTLTGVIHMGGPERLSRYEMAQRVAAALGADSSLLIPTSLADIVFPEPRARDVSLVSDRYHARFGAAPGRTLEQVLPLILKPGASPRLS